MESHVHAELVSLHAALQKQQRALAKRETDLARDEGILRGLLDKEATRLTSSAEQQLDASASQHVARLEAALESLRAQCAALARQHQKAPRAAKKPPAQPTQPVQRAIVTQINREKPLTAPTLPQQPCMPSREQRALVQQRELVQQLDRARKLSASLLLELELLEGSPADDALTALEATRRHALPGAADALIADGGTLSHAARCRLLTLLWRHAAAPPAAKDNSAPLWERRVAQFLIKASSADTGPLFGSSPTAPLAALLLLRLGRRAHQRAAAAAAGLGEMAEALACLRRLGGGSGPTREKLLELGAIDELVPVLRLSQARPQLARIAATTLIALCVTPPSEEEDAAVAGTRSHAMASLATPAFVDAALTALEADGTADGPEPIGACVSLLLQRLSAGPPRWRSLLAPAKLRRAVCRLQADKRSGAFILANLHSALRNVQHKEVMATTELWSDDESLQEGTPAGRAGAEAVADEEAAVVETATNCGDSGGDSDTSVADEPARSEAGDGESQASGREGSDEEAVDQEAAAWAEVAVEELSEEQPSSPIEMDEDHDVEPAADGGDDDEEETDEEEDDGTVGETAADDEDDVHEAAATEVGSDDNDEKPSSPLAALRTQPNSASNRASAASPYATIADKQACSSAGPSVSSCDWSYRDKSTPPQRPLLDLEAAYFSPGVIVPGTRE